MGIHTEIIALRVRTGLCAGEAAEQSFTTPADALGTAVSLYQTAAQVANGALTNPDALKLFMDYLPKANA